MHCKELRWFWRSEDALDGSCYLWVSALFVGRSPQATIIVANDRESVHKDAAETGKDEALKN
jgi:hypothetical protein